MKTFCVYKHTSPSGKVYIGITSKKPEYRWNHGENYVGNEHFYRAITKYGWDNFQHEIISQGLTKEDACALEQRLIAEYHSNDYHFGYNKSIGGECPFLGTHPVRPKGSLSPRFGKKHTEEAKRKMSESRKGQQRGALNHKSKRVVCIELNKTYESLGEAERDLGLKRKLIWRACQRNNGSSGGYHWRWADAS